MLSTQRGNILTSILAGGFGALVVMIVILNSNTFLSRLAQKTTTPTTPASPITLTPNESLVVETIEKVEPAVVSIVITKDVPVLERFFDSAPNQSPFDDFFGRSLFPQFEFRVPRLEQRGTERREVGGGSGFLVSADGLIVTNRHVVADETADYTVFTSDGERHEVRVSARDPANDIAILKIKGNDFPFLQFGDSDQLKVGQTAIAIGNALSEFRNTVSVGVISGLSRSIIAGNSIGQAEQLDHVIQTDAAINPGNSGGPLLSTSGRVIGVNVAVALGSENIGFALPANVVKGVVTDVQRDGRIIRPYLGVRYIPITPVIQERNKLSVDYGVLVSRGETVGDLAVIPGSSADKAGIKEGDIILEADGKRLGEDVSLASIIRVKKVEDSVVLKILSQGSEKSVTVKLEEIPQ